MKTRTYLRAPHVHPAPPPSPWAGFRWRLFIMDESARGGAVRRAYKVVSVANARARVQFYLGAGRYGVERVFDLSEVLVRDRARRRGRPRV